MRRTNRRATVGFRSGALAVGLVAAAVSAIACWFDPAAVLPSWLVAWLFFLGIALGALANVMIHELTGGAWGFAIRPPLEAAIGTLPVLAMLGIPLAFGEPYLFPWARSGASSDPHLAARLWYLNAPAFDLRAIAYFSLWIAIAVMLRSHWRRRKTNAESAPQPQLHRLSIIGLLIYALTMTLASVDWVMSLSADWYSTTFGLLMMVGQSLGAFAFAVACSVLGGYFRVDRQESGNIAGDIGNLLLTFVMLWAYLAFTQFLIIWAEDLPAETAWYLVRAEARWRWMAIAVMVLQFAVPFVAMLFRPFKRDPRQLALLCLIVLAAHGVELFWSVVPGFRTGQFLLQWTDPVAVLAVGGIWTVVFLRLLGQPPAISLQDRVGLANHA